mgnify:CR=1 FL=1|tara:strand:- start:24 stop:839 length:816 start_codon:yes stop_codon:yes gene_type:complete
MIINDYVFPDKPFMIALGTSHTYGDCEGPATIKITAYDRVANELGLELVKIGLSGCKTEDLLQATNELAHHNALNDNCKLFILEPRLGDRTVRLPIEVVDKNTRKSNILEELSSMPYNSLQLGKGIISNWNENKDKIRPTIQIIGHDCRANTTSLRFSSLPIKTYIEASTFYAHSLLDVFNSVTIIDSIRHIVEANNVKFRWQTVRTKSDLLSSTRKLLGEHSTLFDNFINNVQCSINKSGINADELKCKCHHFNKEGHKMWYEHTIDYLR